MHGSLNVNFKVDITETYQRILQDLVADHLGYAEHILRTTVLNLSI
jgi:hypothetical protein